jgi:MOSC domain-containing protein YiiM
VKLVSVNTGLPREVYAGDRIVLTSIFKAPVEGRVPIRNDNLAGDRQSDPSVHGGRFKALYAYPSEHYPYWQERMRDMELPWGSFGENLTTQGILEDAIHVGDRLQMGSAEFIVTQPRMPCFKLGIRMGRPEIVKQFLDSRRSGFYLSVASEGDVAAGDAIAVLDRHPAAISIPEILRLYLREDTDRARLEAAIAIPALSDAWRRDLIDRLAGAS